MKMHIADAIPWDIVVVPKVGEIGLYKSLCGIKEPLSKCWRGNEETATCKKCIKIQAQKTGEKNE